MKVIITGATGMVGRSVLNECIESKAISKILLINRRAMQLNDPKVEEIIHEDLSDISSISNQLIDFDACFFCMGVSALGISKETYENLTFTLTVNFAKEIFKTNPNSVFIYVSGQGTDSTENSSRHWARIKGKTENVILNMGFKDAYAFRPGLIIPEKGVKSRTNWYQYIYLIMTPFFPLLKMLNSATSSSAMGLAMINLVLEPQVIKYLENKDINKLSKK